MREIKFRAWNKKTKMMVDLKSITPCALDEQMNNQMALQGFDGLFIPFMNDLEIMQYTGLKDKNGKEIYEGDIIEAEFHPWPVYVVYHNNRGCFGWQKDKKKEDIAVLTEEAKATGAVACTGVFGTFEMDLDLIDEHGQEVIGNIHENPEF